MLKKAVLSSLMLLVLFGCKKEDDANKQHSLPVVQAIKLQEKNIPLSFEFAARAQGSKETEVRARVGGILLKRNYVEGASVQEGEVLFEIDPEPFKVVLSQAKAKLAQSQAQLKAAETQWVRIEKLFKDRIVSEKSRDDTKANLDALKATVELAQAEVDAAQLNLDYTTVKAPISGLTSLETHSEGSLISTSGEAGLLTKIICLDPVYVMFSASENELQSLSQMVQRGLIRNPGNSGDIKAKLKISDTVEYNQVGDINFINPNIDETTGTVKLRAVFPNPKGEIRPGQFLRLTLNGLTRINALTIPQEAIMQGSNGSFVYRVKDNGVVEIVNVITGLTTPDGEWIIDEGLNDGDVVITSGLMKVRPGMTVKTNVGIDSPEKDNTNNNQ